VAGVLAARCRAVSEGLPSGPPPEVLKRLGLV